MPADPDKLALGNSSKRCGKTREERAGGSERTQHTGSAYASHSQTIGTRIDFFSAKAPPRAAPIAIMCSRLKTIYLRNRYIINFDHWGYNRCSETIGRLESRAQPMAGDLLRSQEHVEAVLKK